MASSVGLHAPRHACAIDEVEIFFNHPADHARSGLGFVGRITVHQHINVGVNVGEHAADNISLSLASLVANNRARRPGDVDGAIARVVVVNVDCGRGQRLAKSLNGSTDCQLFIEARNKHGDVVLARTVQTRTSCCLRSCSCSLCIPQTCSRDVRHGPGFRPGGGPRLLPRSRSKGSDGRFEFDQRASSAQTKRK